MATQRTDQADKTPVWTQDGLAGRVMFLLDLRFQVAAGIPTVDWGEPPVGDWLRSALQAILDATELHGTYPHVPLLLIRKADIRPDSAGDVLRGDD